MKSYTIVRPMIWMYIQSRAAHSSPPRALR